MTNVDWPLELGMFPYFMIKRVEFLKCFFFFFFALVADLMNSFVLFLLLDEWINSTLYHEFGAYE